jgi:predicted ATPase
VTVPTIERIDIEGFTSIVDASVEFGRLNVLVGANGAGKSNLVRALELLGRVVDEDLRVHVARNGGASALVNATLPARQLRLSLIGRADGEIRYDAVLVPTPDDGLFFTDEHIYYRDPSRYRTWWDQSIDRGHRESKLHETVAAPGTGQATAAAVIDLLRGCRVYHFHDTSSSAPVKQPVSSADNLVLRPDAANIAAILLLLRNSSDKVEHAAYRRIVASVRLVAPFFRDFVLEPEVRDQVRLRWREYGSDAVFSAHQLSDGTLRFICLATLLLQPALPALVVLDEPELGLHPYAIVQLAGLLQQAATRSQIIIATQSVTLMNQFELADLIVVERGRRGSSFVRPDASHLQSWLEEYSLGELWEKNLIGGRPGPVAGSVDG